MALDLSKLSTAIDRALADLAAAKDQALVAEKAAQEAIDALAAKVDAADPPVAA